MQVVAMAKERALSDAKLRTATKAADGPYLSDGGGLRFRLSDPTDKHPRGARLAEYRYKLKDADGRWVDRSMYLGTIGEPYLASGADEARPFTLADARTERDTARAKVAKGIDPRDARRLEEAEEAERQRTRLAELDARRTVRDAFKRWDELYLSAHRKDGGAAVRDLFDRHVLPKLGDRTLDTLRRSDMTDLLDGLTAVGKRRTANMALSLVRQFVRWCAVREWLDRDPTLGIGKKDAGGKEAARDRNLSELEIIELRDKLDAAKMPERMREALWLLLATGVRVGELAGAPMREFDLERAEWHIPGERTKNRDPHTVHLSPFAVARVQRLRELAAGSDWLLPGRVPADADRSVAKPISPKYIAKQVNDRQRAVPLKRRTKATATLLLARGEWTPHDLRRTMASRMGDLGIRPDVIERCLNHRPEGIAAVYQRADLMPERRAAFDAWGAKLEALMATASPTNVTALPARERPQTRTNAKAA
jgi:integrase